MTESITLSTSDKEVLEKAIEQCIEDGSKVLKEIWYDFASNQYYVTLSLAGYKHGTF